MYSIWIDKHLKYPWNTSNYLHCSWNSYLYDVVLTPVVGGAVGPGGDVGAGGDGAEVLEVTKIWKKNICSLIFHVLPISPSIIILITKM